MSINEINEQAKESLKKYFKDSQDIQHDDDTKKQLTIEEMYQSVDDEIKEQEKKLEELHQMRHALQHNAKEAYEAVYGKTDEAAEVKHTTVEEMEKELHENVEHQMEYVNELKNRSTRPIFHLYIHLHFDDHQHMKQLQFSFLDSFYNHAKRHLHIKYQINILKRLLKQNHLF